MTARQVAADLQTAARLLERDGWRQGGWGNPGECRCAGGAIIGAIDSNARDPRDLGNDLGNPSFAYRRWNEAVEILSLTVGQSVAWWNDTPGRTADDVIVALHAAADKAEAGALS